MKSMNKLFYFDKNEFITFLIEQFVDFHFCFIIKKYFPTLHNHNFGFFFFTYLSFFSTFYFLQFKNKKKKIITFSTKAYSYTAHLLDFSGML